MSPAADPAVAPAPLGMGRGTLGRQLVVRVVTLVAVLAVLLSSAITLATYQLLVGQVDQQLNTAIDRLQRDGADGGRGDRGGGGYGSGLLSPGQPIGTLYSLFDAAGTSLASGRLAEGSKAPALPSAALAVLHDMPVDNEKRSVDLGPGVGRYRVVAYNATYWGGSGAVDGTLAVGLPLDRLDELLISLIGLEVVLSLLAMVGAAVAARSLVGRSLRPLNRVADTAQQVSRLELDRGEVALAIRVPDRDADPRNEVGRVGLAFNHMLTNVDGALAARQASEMKVRQFVADASHELRNPLAAIRGYAELTRRTRDDMGSDAAYAMARVESEAERMSRLVEDLLLLARLDSGPALDLAPVDLTEIVINSVSDARAAGPDHRWTMDLPDEPVIAYGDEHRLHQVVVNLLANARTHTPVGTTVSTGLTAVAGRAVVTVVDNGPGIPPEIAGQVFERFTRADSSRVRAAGNTAGGSTGLGLAIVSAVIEAHDGTVEVTSQPGHTVFAVTLPLASTIAPVATEPTQL